MVKTARLPIAPGATTRTSSPAVGRSRGVVQSAREEVEGTCGAPSSGYY
jgi:hypothetical protein